jgi:diguanylate cyclase (GGDEF)-like protein
LLNQAFEQSLSFRLERYGVSGLPVTDELPPEPELRLLGECLTRDGLRTEFQPILDLRRGCVFGHEALSRGPAGSAFESAVSMFRLAREHGFSSDLELVAVRRALERFATAGAPGKLFVNFSALALAERRIEGGIILEYLRGHGLSPKQVVIELSENQAIVDSSPAWAALLKCRKEGFEIAIDDLGEGFASLRLWSELRPEYVKLDRHFIHGIHRDPVKLQIARAIQQIAQVSGCTVIAEGIEETADFQVVRDLGISYCQGYLIGYPAAALDEAAPVELWKRMSLEPVLAFPLPGQSVNRVTARKLLKRVDPVSPATENDVVYARFENDPDLQVIPVVDGVMPRGLINRHSIIDRFARPFRRELYGRKPCAAFMNDKPMIVDADISIQEISMMLTEGNDHALYDGFVITEDGRYAGIGTSQNLIREVNAQQIVAARYANPLTLLPGNVPIAEHISRLLAQGRDFVACYADLDNFKPFNDVYGYHRGDEVIQLAARALADVCDPQLDFCGHVGGDDFVAVMQSVDWEARCERVLKMFGERIVPLFSEEDRQRGGFLAEDRRGDKQMFGLTSMSIGVVPVERATFNTHSEVAAAATDAKKMAKREPGNAMFVERRRYPASSIKPPLD